ncbi:MAG: ferrochelatase [Planctomycetes bacterium]|nr:ferrochelatase [Planctomycetota bacterium]
MTRPYDCLLILSFGGPNGPEDVMPFLRNVLRGRDVPNDRMREVAEHYLRFGGVSPINAANRALIESVRREIDRRNWRLPVYWGNRNWHPLLADTVRAMRDDGMRAALAFTTSAFSSYAGCRQYLEDIDRAIAEVGEDAPRIQKIRPYFNHPAFIDACVDRARRAIDRLPIADRHRVEVLYSAHSIPRSMASACDYAAQLEDVARTISDALGIVQWRLVYQSRSGPPSQPWLEPDVRDVIRARHAARDLSPIAIVPIGFVSDHMEVIYDLDHEARELCDALRIPMVRAETAGTHPCFIGMVCDLVEEMQGWRTDRPARGRLGPRPDACAAGCCIAPP